MRLPRSIIAVLAALAVGALLGRTGVADLGGAESGTDTGTVVRVIDGDTIHVRLGGVRERVRYIGVDTPETHKPGTPVECYGRAASARNEQLVAGERVRLKTDAEARDRYGRLLAYVYRVRDGRFVNAELVRGGYAQPLTIPPNVRHAEAFADLAREARGADRGLWRACR
jgi:micrococcal nuclease